MTIKIEKKKLESFLKSIQKTTESCIVNVEASNFYTVCSSEDNSIILYAKTTLLEPCETPLRLNILNVRRFLVGLNVLKDGVFFMDFSENRLKCGMEKSNGDDEYFIFYLADDSVIKKCSANIKKISELDFDTSFNLSNENIKRILSSSVFAENIGKVYISTSKDEKIIAEINDKTLQNIDNFSIVLSDTWKGKKIESEFPLNLEIFKTLNAFNGDITIKMNNKFKIVIFFAEKDNLELKYIVSSLIK